MIQPLSREWGKWFQTMKVSWSELFVYRVNFLLMVLGPMLVFFFIKYNLWVSIYAGHTSSVIGKYTLPEMLSYHLWFLMVSILSMAHNSARLAEDIRLGRISNYLIYPFSLWEFTTAKFLALQTIQIGIAILTLAITYWGVGHLLGELQWQALLAGTVISLLAGIFWYTIQYIIGLMAFWLEETWTFQVIFRVMAHFLSGAIIPLDLYPPWIVGLLEYAPFPYMAYVPVQTFTGDYPTPWKAVLILLFWIGMGSLFARWLWSKGLKHYTAAGM